MDNQGKYIALVTGATGGLGTAMCQRLYRDGYRVAAHYRNPEKAKEWSERMRAEGYEFDMFLSDVCSFEDTGRMIKEIEEQLGPIDVLINNAGITRDKPLYKMSYDDWNAVITTNLYSVFNTCRQVIDGMRERQYGRIINISSINGEKGQFGQTNYSAAKAGMHGFTKALALEVASRGITVNTISPGYIATDMVMAVREDVRNAIVAQIPVGRLGGTEEIAFLVSFLASKNASFITGANYPINGGHHMS